MVAVFGGASLEGDDLFPRRAAEMRLPGLHRENTRGASRVEINKFL